MKTPRFAALLCVCLLLLTQHSVTGSLPTAQSVTWDSVNFKTLLKWSPKPTNYTYTVEFSQRGQDREKTPNCIQTSETECDLTAELRNLKGNYKADILSEPMRGATHDLIEFPHTTSSFFCPYNDTNITRPDFRIEVIKSQRQITLHVEDVPTALHKDDRRLTIRDIFKDDLQYRVIYWKASSSGKKQMDSKSSEVVLTKMDMDESYCFNVQAYISSRIYGKQLGELSQVRCSVKEEKSFLDDYSILVLGGSAVLIIVIVAVVIAGIVVCWRRRRNAKSREECI